MNLTGLPPYQKNTKHRSRGKARLREDREFLDWLKTLPSALSGRGPCDPAHYRTAANSGIGCKPIFSAIPLTRDEHRLQHQIGQFNFMPREWWEEKVRYYIEMWNRLT